MTGFGFQLSGLIHLLAGIRVLDPTGDTLRSKREGVILCLLRGLSLGRDDLVEVRGGRDAGALLFSTGFFLGFTLLGFGLLLFFPLFTLGFGGLGPFGGKGFVRLMGSVMASSFL